jgi:RecA/RadA recombinase
MKRVKLEDDEQQGGYELLGGPVEFFSTGSLPLNLAASNKGVDGGWARARIINLVGDRSSGKTLLALEGCFNAWCTFPFYKSRLFPKVKEVKVQFNSVEGVMDFPLEAMYGTEFFEAIDWTRHGTAEEAGRRVLREMDNQKPGTSIIHVIDSWDALDSEEDRAAFEKSIKEDKPIEGSYHLGKQAFGSKHFFKAVADRLAYNRLDFTLFIISQTRERIGVTFGEKYYRAGGKALDFYSHQICWLHESRKIPRESDGEKMTVGVDIIGNFKKNKVAPPFRQGKAVIYFNHGVDDYSSMVDYGWPRGKKGTVFKLESMEKPYKMREAFIERIIKDRKKKELEDFCEEKWKRVVQNTQVERPPKFEKLERDIDV